VAITDGQDDRTGGCPRCHSLMVVETFVDYESGSGLPCFLGWRCPICGAIYDSLSLLHQSMGWESVSRRSHRIKTSRRPLPNRQRASSLTVGAGVRRES